MGCPRADADYDFEFEARNVVHKKRCAREWAAKTSKRENVKPLCTQQQHIVSATASLKCCWCCHLSQKEAQNSEATAIRVANSWVKLWESDLQMEVNCTTWRAFYCSNTATSTTTANVDAIIKRQSERQRHQSTEQQQQQQ